MVISARAIFRTTKKNAQIMLFIANKFPPTTESELWSTVKCIDALQLQRQSILTVSCWYEYMHVDPFQKLNHIICQKFEKMKGGSNTQKLWYLKTLIILWAQVGHIFSNFRSPSREKSHIVIKKSGKAHGHTYVLSWKVLLTKKMILKENPVFQPKGILQR